MKLNNLIKIGYILVISCFLVLLILIYLKLFLNVQLILGALLLMSIVIIKVLPTAFEKYPSLLKILAIGEGDFYFISLVLGFFYLYFLVPMNLVGDPLHGILILSFLLLMWPFRTGLDILWAHFRGQIPNESSGLETKIITFNFFSKLLKFHLIIIFINFILGLFFLNQYRFLSDHIDYIVSAPFIFFGADLVLLVYFFNLNEYWQKVNHIKQNDLNFNTKVIILNRQFYKKIIIPALITILLISSIIMIPYLFLAANFEFIVLYCFYIGLKVFLIVFFFPV